MKKIEDYQKEICCPDCGNKNLKKGEPKFDPLKGLKKSTLECPQCRRWMFERNA
jgi:DNA-directed RNA polymerase subunit RPC12/RpoP